MLDAFHKVFGDRVTENPIEDDPGGGAIRAVPVLGLRDRLHRHDPRDWRRARGSFDTAYAEFKQVCVGARTRLVESVGRLA